MIFSQLPPVGESILTERRPAPEFEGYRAIWLQSGTAALALALLQLRREHPEVARPEVLIPAYACPDLIAAADYAGFRPVAVDTARNDFGFNLGLLAHCANRNTLAVVAVNFLGIRERLDAIRSRLPGVALIEDNAQWFPRPGEGPGLVGDFVVTSFGRGKPVSTLGGGLLLVREDRAPEEHWLAMQLADPGALREEQAWPLHARIGAYNLMRRPGFYYWLARLPFLGLGSTRFRELRALRPMSAIAREMVAANAADRGAADPWREECYDQCFSELQGLDAVALRLPSRRGRLLRYPVLCADRRERDKILRALERRGLGASALYRRPLAEIPGAREVTHFPHPTREARRLADRLLTLPLHSDVQQRHLNRIRQVVARRMVEAPAALQTD